MPDPTGWNLKIAYDYRFGTFMFMPMAPGGVTVAQFPIRVADLLNAAKIPAHEMRQYIKDAEQPQGPIRDMEEFRREAIVNTDLDGKVVLDVGGYMGEFSRLALDHGAKQAIVLDTEQWRHYGWADNPLSGVEYIKGEMTDYVVVDDENLATYKRGGPEFLPRPDVLVLYNVLYHVKNPIAFLDRAREIIKPGGTMLLCTLFRYHDGAWVYYYEPRECNPTDESVFFGPSLIALERWLKTTGWEFKQEGLTFDRVIYRCTPTEREYRQSEA